MGIERIFARSVLIVALTAVGSSAIADELGARYDQSLLNGDSLLNGAVLSGAWQSSFASSLVNELGVMDRPRPDYSAKGLPLGGFRLYPTLYLGAGETDNVYATETNTSSDSFWQVNPSVALRSDWGRDSLAVYGGSQTTLYDKFSTENITNWDVGSAGRLDIWNDSDLRANVYYDALHEPRTSPNEPGDVAKPTAYALFHSDAAFDIKPDRFGITVGGAVDDYNYQNTPLVGGGELDNAGRDEDIYTGYGRASYDFSPGYSAFLGVSYEDRSFLNHAALGGLDRDSTGYHVDLGSQFFISHLVQGQVFVGYLSQTFKSPFSNINAVDYGANINWYASPLLTVHLGASRTIDDTTLFGASASDDQTAYVSADYELLRNVIIQGQVGYMDQKFIGISRDDKIPVGNLQATWLINHNVSLVGQYQYNHRNSDAAFSDYTQNTFTLGVNLQL
jgi:hypothetical protein